MVLNSNFKYYDNYEFHWLKEKCSNNCSSIFHTNICSLQANSEKLEHLANNLNHNFDVTILSETWTSENNNPYFKAPSLQGYQPYHGIKGKALKSGCGFHLKSGKKSKPGMDLEI